MIDTGGRYHVTKLISGSRISDMMQFARYSPAQLVESFRKQLTIRVEAGVLTKAMADQLATEYEAGAAQGTYLE